VALVGELCRVRDELCGSPLKVDGVSKREVRPPSQEVAYSWREAPTS
jgi:hypothetical protein